MPPFVHLLQTTELNHGLNDHTNYIPILPICRVICRPNLWNAFQTIRVLCNANWMPRNLVLLSSLLRDVSSLSQSEWDYAMDTFVTKFDLIEPDEMPAIVFQLLLISKALNGSKIISALINYYNTRCWGNISTYTSNWEVCISNFQTYFRGGIRTGRTSEFNGWRFGGPNFPIRLCRNHQFRAAY